VHGLRPLGDRAGDARGPRAAEVVRWLALKRTGVCWRSTRVTAPVAMALADYLAARPAEVTSDYRLRVEWNGKACSTASG